MEISRRDLEEGKYDRQPGTAAVIGIVDDLTRSVGNNSSPIVHVTSGTYRPSRTLSAALAGMSAERRIGIATYGNDLMNAIKGDNSPAPVSQLPGELHAMARQAVDLKAALAA